MASALVNWTSIRRSKLPMNDLFPGLKCYVGRMSFGAAVGGTPGADDYDQAARPTLHSATTAGSTVPDVFSGIRRIKALFPFTFGSDVNNSTAGQATGAAKIRWTDSTQQLDLVNGGLTGNHVSVIDEVEAATQATNGPLAAMTFECLVMGT